jgi:hypothetical protein
VHEGYVRGLDAAAVRVMRWGLLASRLSVVKTHDFLKLLAQLYEVHSRVRTRVGVMSKYGCSSGGDSFVWSTALEYKSILRTESVEGQVH